MPTPCRCASRASPKRHAAQCGSVNVLSGAPYGYRYLSKWVGVYAARYDIVLEKARVVRRIFLWVGQERYAIAEVCRRLQRQGKPSPSRATIASHKVSRCFSRCRISSLRCFLMVLFRTMSTTSTSWAHGDLARILDRHASRRIAEVSTVSVLCGPVGACGGTWRHWASVTGRSIVIAPRNRFPTTEWVRSVVGHVDLPAMAVQCLAQRAGSDPDSLLAAWSAKTVADRQRFQHTLVPEADDELLFAVATLAVDSVSYGTVASALSSLGDRIVPLIVRLVPAMRWPGVLFVAGTNDDFSAISAVAVQWALSVPAVPIAVAVPVTVWREFLMVAPESRAKALLREGELAVPGIDPATVERTLSEAGAARAAVNAIVAVGPDSAMVESAVNLIRVTGAPPATQTEADRARSAAERFLFAFLESLPETTGRFELNAALDFPFGPRPAEVDLLCRSPRIAIELDGYFHFLAADGYRRDRAKDWELQRRGYLVLRFLAEDVIPNLEMIRDRILDALTVTPLGGQH